jgi:hypothetical protein
VSNRRQVSPITVEPIAEIYNGDTFKMNTSSAQMI